MTPILRLHRAGALVGTRRGDKGPEIDQLRSRAADQIKTFPGYGLDYDQRQSRGRPGLFEDFFNRLSADFSQRIRTDDQVVRLELERALQILLFPDGGFEQLDFRSICERLTQSDEVGVFFQKNKLI